MRCKFLFLIQKHLISMGKLVCKLCKINNNLIHAHIISEFLYEGMYDKSNRIFMSWTSLPIRPKEKGNCK